MITIIGACLCLVVIILSVLLICGLPLGELTMGGQYKVYPGKLRIVLVVQLILQVFFVITILQVGGFMPLWFSYNNTKIVCIVMAVYLSLNVVLNFISKSKKEKYVITPLSLMTAICFWITALQM
ncbi:MAG: hypothetical protein IJA36_03535 [Lachnospiraceae bacterium]|nr:hypothetical protein [Lachnospiraceae bacterium]